MKKIKWLAIIAIAFMALLLLCCNNGFGSSATVKGDGITVKDTLEITVSADENLEIFGTSNANNGNARTITSQAFAMNGADNLNFYLWGEAQTGQILPPKKVTVDPTDAVKGTVKLDIDCYNWNLTLVATKGPVAGVADVETVENNTTAQGLIMAEAVLIGYANVDMMFTNQIQFTISPKGLTKTGWVELYLSREGDWEIPAGYVATAYIYDLTTGEKITGAGDTSENLDTVIYDTSTSVDKFITEATAESTYGVSTNASYDANTHNIKPGIYLFQIEFVKTGELRKYVWNDTIIILPGQGTSQVHDAGTPLTKKIVIPNLIGNIPDDITSLSVEFTKTASYNPGHDVEPGFYTAKFTWNPENVKTETNYALEILELSDTATASDFPTTDPVWPDPADGTIPTTTWTKTLWDALDGTAKVNQKFIFDYDNDVRNSHIYKEGSLFTNKTSISFYFELGKRYVARIAAQNNAGLSENWTYVTLPTGGYKTINQYRVTYHLQQGTWKEIDEATAKTVDQIRYDGQKTAGYKIIVPNLDDGADPTPNPTTPIVEANGAKWYYWSQGVGGAAYPCTTAGNYNTPEDYMGYKNLDLYAVYSRDGTVIIQDDNDYDILQTYVTIDKKDGSTVIPVKKERLTYSKGTDALGTAPAYNTNFNVTLPASDADPATNDEWKYDKVTFQITYGGRTYVAQEQIGAARDSANAFNVDFSNMPTGYVYNCKFTAHYQRTIVSYPFALYLTD